MLGYLVPTIPPAATGNSLSSGDDTLGRWNRRRELTIGFDIITHVLLLFHSSPHPSAHPCGSPPSPSLPQHCETPETPGNPAPAFTAPAETQPSPLLLLNHLCQDPLQPPPCPGAPVVGTPRRTPHGRTAVASGLLQFPSKEASSKQRFR